MKSIIRVLCLLFFSTLAGCGGSGDSSLAPSSDALSNRVPAAITKAMAVADGDLIIGFIVDGGAEEKIVPHLNADRTRFSFSKELSNGNHSFEIRYYIRVQDNSSPGLTHDIEVQRYSTVENVLVLGGSNDTLEIGSADLPLQAQPDDDEDGATNLSEVQNDTYFLGNNADLSGITLNGLGLGSFDPELNEYNVLEPETVSSLNFSYVSSHSGALVTASLNGLPVNVSESIPLEPGDNVLAIAVESEDRNTFKQYTLIINRNRFPELQSFGDIILDENLADAVIPVIDPDGDAITATLVGGADQDKFSISADGRILSFASAPDFEVPLDANSDNIYEAIIDFDDGRGGLIRRAIDVRVRNINALKIEINYPPPGGNLGGQTQFTTVTGNLFDEEDGIVSINDIDDDNILVAVNNRSADIDVASQGKPARWSANIPIGFPTDTISATVISNDTPIADVSQTILNQAVMVEPNAAAVDLDNNRILVTDRLLQAVISIDLTNGTRKVLSDINNGIGASFHDGGQAGLNDVVLDPVAARNRVLVADPSEDAIFAVDLTTGNRSILSNSSTGSGPDLGFPEHMAVDEDQDRLFVTDGMLDAILAVDLSTGDRTILSSSSVGTGPDIPDPDGIAILDAASNRVLVSGRNIGQLLEIDLNTGNRSVVSGPGRGDGPAFGAVTNESVLYDHSTNRAYVTADDGVIEVDIATGNRSQFSDDAMTKSGLPVTFSDIVLDQLNNRFLLIDDTSDAVFSVDLSSKQLSLLSDSKTGTGPTFSRPDTLAVDLQENRILVFDPLSHQIMQIDLSNGDRSVLFNNVSPETTESDELIIDKNRRLAYIVNRSPAAVVEVDLNSGLSRLLSDATTGSGTVLVQPEGAALDKAENRLLVIDANLDAVLAVDLTTGDRTILSDSITGVGTNFIRGTGISLDAVNKTAFVVDRDVNGALSINLTNGDRTLLSGSGVGLGPDLQQPDDVVYDSTNNRLLVLEQRRRIDGIYTIDIASGDRVILSDTTTGSGPVMTGAIDFDVNVDLGLAYILDEGLKTIVAVELGSGERAVVSQ